MAGVYVYVCIYVCICIHIRNKFLFNFFNFIIKSIRVINNPNFFIFFFFKLFQINDLPKPSYMNKTISDLKIGTYDNIETVIEDTTIILALKKFVERRVSALPVVDEKGRLVDIFAKFDVIVSKHFLNVKYFICL